MKSVAIVIPIFQPNEYFVGIVTQLAKHGLKIVVVDDGSKKNLQLFSQIKNLSSVIIVTHETNRGKGNALKSGFKYVLDNYKNLNYIFTIDGDGQHSVSDLLKLLKFSNDTESDLILGVRKFAFKKMPFKSWIGNQLARVLFSLLGRRLFLDTQCGLRGYGKKSFFILLSCAGDRFDFESKLLLAIIRKRMNIAEVEIETIYHNNNKSSHYLAIYDSFKILRTLFFNKK